MGRSKTTRAPQFKRIEGMRTGLYPPGPLFELGLPVFMGAEKAHCCGKPSQDRMASVEVVLYLVDSNKSFR